MGFFQSFINDANQHLKQAEPVVRTPLTESLFATDADSASDAFVAPPHSIARAPSVPQNVLPDVELEPVAPTEFKRVEQTASKQPTEPVLQKAALNIAAQDKQTTIKSEPNQQIVSHPAVVSKRPTEPVLQKAALNIAARDKQLTIKSEPNQQIDHPPTAGAEVVGEAKSQFTTRQQADNPAEEPVHLKPLESTVVVNPHKQLDAFDLVEEEEEVFMPPGRLAKEKKTNRPAFKKDAEVIIQRSPLHQAAITQEAAVQKNEATMTAETITASSMQQAKEALGLFLPAAEKPSSVHEKSVPQVQIGTIEVIVESAPVAQRSPSHNTGFTRDPGRYYQRRL